jgi:hypothetical protein
MSEIKYLVTVDSETGVPTKLQLVGDAGELTELDLSNLSWEGANTGAISVVVNVYGSGSIVPQGEVKVSEYGARRCRFPSPPPPRVR